MELRVLGSGTIAGRTGRNCAGFLVDDRLLLDCGPGVWSSLYAPPAPDRPMNHILLSHFHVDHTADLIPILWRRWVLETEWRTLLTVHGPRGLEEWFGKLTCVHHEWVGELSLSLRAFHGPGPPGPQEPLRIDTDGGGYTLHALPTGHSAHSVCLKVSDENGHSLFYSGDTGWNEKLVALAKGCDLAVLDCAYPSARPTEDHLTPELAGKIAERGGVRRLVLTHLYPETWATDPVQEAERYFGGEIIAAVDGLIVRV